MVAKLKNLWGLIVGWLFMSSQYYGGATILRKRIPGHSTALSFINSYGMWFYHAMRFDKARMKAYKEAIASAVRRANGERIVFFDVGAGAHMPLTRMLLRHPETFVHVLEANEKAYKHARAFAERRERFRERCRIYHVYSSELDPRSIEPQASVILHEIVGVVASAEGCVAAVESLRGKHDEIKTVMPKRIRTSVVAVAEPRLGVMSRLASFLFSRTTALEKTPGVQCIYNPEMRLLSSKGYAETYLFSEKSYIAETTNRLRIERGGRLSGVYLAPEIDVDGSSSKIDGLEAITSWGVYFVRFDKEVDVRAGDTLAVDFCAPDVLDDPCPSYSLRARFEPAEGPVVPFQTIEWRGPMDRMS